MLARPVEIIGSVQARLERVPEGRNVYSYKATSGPFMGDRTNISFLTELSSNVLLVAINISSLRGYKPMNESLAQHYLEDSIASLRAYKKMADKAIAQLKDDEFFVTLDEEANSVAVIMKHMAGNMFSRWTDFLTTDGEKPNRHRDLEFVIEPNTAKDEVITYWEKGWQCVFDALEPLKADDLGRKVLIRGEEHTVIQAINRQLMHYSNHIGQIVFLAKHFRSAEWKTLSIPRNRSAEFNAYLAKKPGAADKEEQLEAVVDFAGKDKKE